MKQSAGTTPRLRRSVKDHSLHSGGEGIECIKCGKGIFTDTATFCQPVMTKFRKRGHQMKPPSKWPIPAPFLLNCPLGHQLFPWCSGYHIRLTRGRSPVRSRAKTENYFGFLITYLLLRIGSPMHNFNFKLVPVDQYCFSFKKIA